MFTGVQFTHFIQANPALAVFLTVALGFLLGKAAHPQLSLGTVTSVLLVGVVVGQLRIEIPEPAKTLFFLMFLFRRGVCGRPAVLPGVEEGRIASGGLRRGGLFAVFGVGMALLLADGLYAFAGCGAAGRVADDVGRAGRGDRYDSRAAGRSGNRSQARCLFAMR